MSTPDFRQSYKNRAEAFELFIVPQKLPVGQTKFYSDMKRLGMIQPDKTITLAALMAYKTDELRIDTTTGRFADEEASKDLSDRERRASVAKAEADARTARVKADEAERERDDKWLLREDAWGQVAALIGTLRDSLRHSAHLAAPALITFAGGDASRIPEVYEGIEEMIFTKAFNEVVASGRVDVVFEAVDDEG